MIAKINTISLLGLKGVKVEVQVDINNGLFEFNIVGMADREVIEAKKRVISAIKNSGFIMPMQRITVNLAPADMAKSSTGFDLPIAVAILVASRQLRVPDPKQIFWGELGLDGKLQNTYGSLSVGLACLEVKEQCELILPTQNAAETAILKRVKSFPLKALKDLPALYTGKVSPLLPTLQRKREELPDLWILNNPALIRAMQIVGLGRHNLLMIGPPGVGKSFLAKLIGYFLPDVTEEECIEISRVYSVAGLITHGLLNTRPIRSPHHSITRPAFIGGGTKFKPGEISLAHKGVLFLDEVNMFQKDLLETLRQPLEDKKLILARGNYSYDLPADFILLAAMNPCKCGNFGSREKSCICTVWERKQFWNKMSKPLLDRIDMQIYIPNKINAIIQNNTNNKVVNLNSYREMINRADVFRKERFKGEVKKGRVDKLESFEGSARELVIQATENLELSMRGYYKLVSMARTIADLELKEQVNRLHVAEAMNYRLIQQ